MKVCVNKGYVNSTLYNEGAEISRTPKNEQDWRREVRRAIFVGRLTNARLCGSPSPNSSLCINSILALNSTYPELNAETIICKHLFCKARLVQEKSIYE